MYSGGTPMCTCICCNTAGCSGTWAGLSSSPTCTQDYCASTYPSQCPSTPVVNGYNQAFSGVPQSDGQVSVANGECATTSFGAAYRVTCNGNSWNGSYVSGSICSDDIFAGTGCTAIPGTSGSVIVDCNAAGSKADVNMWLMLVMVMACSLFSPD